MIYFGVLMVICGIQHATGLQTLCSPDALKSPLLAKGLCFNTSDISDKCKDLEAGESTRDCAAFDGNWCCYVPPFSKNLQDQSVKDTSVPIKRALDVVEETPESDASGQNDHQQNSEPEEDNSRESRRTDGDQDDESDGEYHETIKQDDDDDQKEEYKKGYNVNNEQKHYRKVQQENDQQDEEEGRRSYQNNGDKSFLQRMKQEYLKFQLGDPDDGDGSYVRKPKRYHDDDRKYNKKDGYDNNNSDEGPGDEEPEDNSKKADDSYEAPQKPYQKPEKLQYNNEENHDEDDHKQDDSYEAPQKPYQKLEKPQYDNEENHDEDDHKQDDDQDYGRGRRKHHRKVQYDDDEEYPTEKKRHHRKPHYDEEEEDEDRRPYRKHKRHNDDDDRRYNKQDEHNDNDDIVIVVRHLNRGHGGKGFYQEVPGHRNGDQKKPKKSGYPAPGRRLAKPQYDDDEDDNDKVEVIKRAKKPQAGRPLMGRPGGAKGPAQSIEGANRKPNSRRRTSSADYYKKATGAQASQYPAYPGGANPSASSANMTTSTTPQPRVKVMGRFLR